jgi:hypothetical protein
MYAAKATTTWWIPSYRLLLDLEPTDTTSSPGLEECLIRTDFFDDSRSLPTNEKGSVECIGSLDVSKVSNKALSQWGL